MADPATPATPATPAPPLDGLQVLDFSTLLPGPLASLMLAEAGAHVIKIERPGSGDEMRSYVPKVGDDSVNFHMLNRGKRSLAIDLKATDAVALLRPLIAKADILIEQFRPGVMARLGLGYDALRAINQRLIYCSITGWGQDGPKSRTAAHDLNYMAESGLLGLTGDAHGAPVLPPILAADIAGGSMPAMINILLALRQRDATGAGVHLDIAMGESLAMFGYWALGEGALDGRWPGRGASLVTGGSPRYAIYRTADERYLAAAPLEDRFWIRFCEIIDLPESLRPEAAPVDIVRAAVSQRIAARSSAAWCAAFSNADVCCSIVATMAEAAADPHVAARGLLARRMAATDDLPLLPVPIAAAFRSPAAAATPAPPLGEYRLDSTMCQATDAVHEA